MNHFVRSVTVAAAVAAALNAGSALAQKKGDAYPTKPINIVVSLQVGTGSDVAMRNLAEKMSQSLGQSVVVINNTGASGLLAAQQIARATADGYSLVALSGATLTTLPHLKKDSHFNPLKDLVPIAMIVSFPSVIKIGRAHV